MNQLGVIYPYVVNGLWVFDDPTVGLTREPFIAGIDKMIDTLTKDIEDAKNGFRLIFSADPFPGYNTVLNWVEEDKPITKAQGLLGFQRGNWYHHPDTNSEGWLCPALLKYFKTAPKHLYVKLEECIADRPKRSKILDPVYIAPRPNVFPYSPTQAQGRSIVRGQGGWIKKFLESDGWGQG